jgi:hypothetical protein
VDAFLADKSPEAYEHLVDRLMGTPQYGERMAANRAGSRPLSPTPAATTSTAVRFMWLVARLDDPGLQPTTSPTTSFTVEQLAGDLLPDATPEQRLATGFVRNNMTNDEGGADPDEYLQQVRRGPREHAGSGRGSG